MVGMITKEESETIVAKAIAGNYRTDEKKSMKNSTNPPTNKVRNYQNETRSRSG